MATADTSGRDYQKLSQQSLDLRQQCRQTVIYQHFMRYYGQCLSLASLSLYARFHLIFSDAVAKAHPLHPHINRSMYLPYIVHESREPAFAHYRALHKNNIRSVLP